MTLETAEQTRELGVRLGRLLRAGDLVVLAGELGAGKTTFTQGIGEGLGVRGPITSPTFVIARVHPSLVGGPELVHVDAYRIGGFDELDDLDLDASLDDAVTVVEWGHGLAEGLAEDRLELVFTTEAEGRGDPGDDPSGDVAGAASGGSGDVPRHVVLTATGARWTNGDGAREVEELVSLR
ncbi:MAG TPA: tRNA (adenosine(37)-N6)-threonylcarbamoyltransferase complex ATPase subunit type 1 TsaE [Segeticoccus sp.]|uniref:tRNA (adenosine(37)-N6)-threonylcarbamoyltransferase complex ATPase subunit type 1 TsaE n=1 Tax=Segeticoccus sp. TaxID=2706531 RepID=UPI002D7EC270|nr:tRNA (adenosine(37)-N6)-threonylcarbamoyltransferase complex ATPase subunit type 1 TsaE [Segeticoccus sp.]HET8599420.1 tRNA (adenosine(37)-N6)-threonylcarbamoyltransferase complex ATPase subunit type 1 TsaE [Segeticoccus sp.]